MSVITLTKDSERGKKGQVVDLPYMVAKQMVKDGAAIYTNPPAKSQKPAPLPSSPVLTSSPPAAPAVKPVKPEYKLAAKTEAKPAEAKPEKPVEHTK